MENNKFSEFIENRRKFVTELLFWCGVVLIVGFVRVNFYGATAEIHTAQYITYSILGTETSRELDPEGTVEMNKGRAKR